MKFNVRLRELREHKQSLQKDVAKYIEVSERVYGYYEEDRFPKDPNTLNKLSEYFNVDMLYLLGITDTNYGYNVTNGEIGIVNVCGKSIPADKLKKIIDFAIMSGLLEDK